MEILRRQSSWFARLPARGGANAPTGLLQRGVEACRQAIKPKYDGRWRPKFTYGEVPTDRGPVSMSPVYYRRLLDGTYEYRAMTTAEEIDYASREAW
jgi:hypothetical protein